MEFNEKKRAVKLGVHIVLVFLIALCILIFTVYLVLSRNFQSMLTEYTIKLVDSMVGQGVVSVENEIKSNREAAAKIATSFVIPDEGETVDFPENYFEADTIRMVYVSENGSIASDGRERDISERRDIVDAYTGKTSLYGPYFNEDNEYVVCYSAPVYKNGKIAGVLSVEKDGYYFCEIIRNIRFVKTGESYIINEQGTDIAVSNQEHISWVNDGYNAKKILEQKDDAITRSIMELEQKGLNGESGVGTYRWEDSMYYVVYAPIPSVNWVLLGGIRREELVSMMQTTFLASFAKGPILQVCVVVFLLLTILIIYWIISSAKKNEIINHKLNLIANYDSLTGLKNRNSYHTALEKYNEYKCESFACIYIDVNGLHEINNGLGHQAGNHMLRIVADALLEMFTQDEVYRIGGDEFVILSENQEKQEICNKINLVRQRLKEKNYDISIGIEWRDADININKMLDRAESAMQNDKRRYYMENGKERQMRTLNQAIEQMVLEKQDADTFLSVLAPEFKGVYFVDLGSDTIRHLFIPSYFEEMLKESEDLFSEAMLLYAERVVMPEFREEFIKFCDYNNIEEALKQNKVTEFCYQKTDESWITLRILKFKTYTAEVKETLWIFENNEER